MKTIKEIWADNKKRRLILGLGCFAFLVFIQLKYLYNTWFDPDEVDIYVYAYEMNLGNVLYRDLPSQHMPFTYYISAFFYLIGAREIYLQRICFYIMFAAFWTGFVFRYRKYFNKWAIVLHPILFFTLLQNQDFSTQILSENLAAIGAEIFILELLRFLKEKDIDIKGCILMSIAVVFTLGTTFVSIYALFYLGLGVLSLEIYWGIKNKQPMKEWWAMMLKRYLKLFGIVLIPWVIFIIYSLATHSLYDCYYQAYVVNREYYPKYIGIGGSALEGFFIPITRLCGSFIEFKLKDLTQYALIEKSMLLMGTLYFPYKLHKKEGVIAGVTLSMFVMSLAERGYFSFHGKQAEAALALLSASVMIDIVYQSKEKFAKAGLARKAYFVTFCFLIFVNYCNNLTENFVFVYFSEKNHYESDTDAVLAITDENDMMWQTNICNTVEWVSKVPNVNVPVSCPWMWEGVGSKRFDRVKQIRPKVIVYTEDYVCWGAKMSEYAPEAYNFIEENYTYLPGTEQIWVRNEDYAESCRILGYDPEAEYETPKVRHEREEQEKKEQKEKDDK